MQRISEKHGRVIRSVHHGVDSGKAMLKFDMTIEFESEAKDDVVPDHSQKRVIMLCVIPNASESNALFAEIYRLLDLPVAEYFHSFHADLKAIAYATGIEGGGCSYPCFVCEQKLTIDVPLAKQFTAGTLRTCATNRRHFKKFKVSGDATAKKYVICDADPLAIFPQKTSFVSFIRFPELHAHLHLNYYIDHICSIHPSAEAWYSHFNQTRSEFHGAPAGTFRGLNYAG